jgi:Ethanolamine utilization protein EutJ (predicted chaperonin)
VKKRIENKKSKNNNYYVAVDIGKRNCVVCVTYKEGNPLYTVITSANTHDVTVAIDTVDSMVIKRPSSKPKDKKKKKKMRQNLCLDKAYHSKKVE